MHEVTDFCREIQFFCVFVIIISVHKISEVIERAMSKNIIDEMRAFYHFQEIHYVHFHSLDILEINYFLRVITNRCRLYV